jgi:hypothetical protein
LSSTCPSGPERFAVLGPLLYGLVAGRLVGRHLRDAKARHRGLVVEQMPARRRGFQPAFECVDRHTGGVGRGLAALVTMLAINRDGPAQQFVGKRLCGQDDS